jgi:tape measure domain-containing protein
MSMDISRLGIEVESTGIKEATVALQGRNGQGGLVGAASKAETKVTALVASMAKFAGTGLAGSTQALAAAFGGLTTTLASSAATAKALSEALETANKQLPNMRTRVDDVAGALDRKARVSHVALNTLKAMTTAAIIYSGVGLTQSIVKSADEWANFEARLNRVTGSTHNGKVALEEMYDVSQRLRVPLDANVRLFARIAEPMQRMGKTGEEAVQVVEGIATALQLNGSNAAEAGSAMLQLSQSFGSGLLNGAEFNAVAENGTVILDALAKSMGRNKEDLKKLGSEGKIPISDLVKAILEIGPSWKQQFAVMPVTVEGAMQRVKNAWQKAIGEMGKDVGFSLELGKAIKIIEDMTPAVAKGLGEAFIGIVKWVDTNKVKLGEIWEQVKGIGKDVFKIAESMLGLAGNAAMAGNEFNLLATVLFSLRLGVAGLVDGFNTIRAVVAGIGGFIGEYLISPITHFIGKVLGALVEKVAVIISTLSRGMGAVGMDAAAESLNSVASSALSVAKDLKEAGKVEAEFGRSLLNVSSQIVEDMANGKSAVALLLSEQEKLKKEMAKPVKGTFDESWGRNGKGKPAPKEEKRDKASERAAAAIERENEELGKQLKIQTELNERIEKYGLAYDKIGPNRQKVLELEQKILAHEKKRGDVKEWAVLQEQLFVAKEIADKERLFNNTKQSMQAQKDMVDKQASGIATLRGEVQKAEAAVANYGKAKGWEQVDAIANLQNQIADLDSMVDGSASVYQKEYIAGLKEELALRERLQAADAAMGQLEVQKELDKLLDPSKAAKFGNSLADSFGKAGKAAGGVIKALENMAVRESKLEKLREVADKRDPKERTALALKLNEIEVKDRLAGYGEMAAAGKQFFEEGSKGYKVMEAAERTFRAFEMAMAIKSFVEKSGLLNAFTGLFVTSKATEATAEGSSVAANLTANAAKQASNATTALTSALAAPFPTNIAAFAMVAAMLASIGVAVGGGGGGNLSADRQAKQGTGTVFGDPDAKSESISKSISLLAENSDIGLEYSAGMLTSLLNIEASLTGATNAILRNGGSITGRGFEGMSKGASLFTGVGALDKIFGTQVFSKIFGFGSKSEMKDSGITAGTQSVGNILTGGFKGSSYQDIETTKKALFITYSKSTDRALETLDESIATEFTNVIESMVDGITAAAEPLGMNADSVRKSLEDFTVAIGDISLKGLSAEEIQKQLEAVFSGVGDDLTKRAFGSLLDPFQQAGEGLLETAMRVAGGIDVANYELDKLGLTAINFADIINKSGNVAAEIVRQSILAVEANTGVGAIVSTLTGSAQEIAKTYTDLLEVRRGLQDFKIAGDVSTALIRAAGGLEALQDALESYGQNYFGDAERTAMETSRLQKEFAKLGLAMPTTKTGFRALVESLSASGATGQELAMKVLLLNGAFADLLDNTQALYDEAVSKARDDLSAAYERESSALKDVKERFAEFAEGLKDFRYSLLLGDQSTLTNAEKYATAQARYDAVATAAMSGDEKAIEQFQSVAQELLSLSRIMNASGAGYTADFDKVLAQTIALEEMTAGKATIAEQQLAALDKQVEGLMTVNESVLTVAQAIDALTVALGGSVDGKATIIPVDGRSSAYAMDYSQYGADNTVALVEEIKALRVEVATLRTEQAQQTSAIISSNYDANERNAVAVVEGQKDAASTANYRQNANLELV